MTCPAPLPPCLTDISADSLTAPPNPLGHPPPLSQRQYIIRMLQKPREREAVRVFLALGIQERGHPP